MTGAPEGVTVTISCAAGGAQARITNVTFASFGTPAGACGAFFEGAITAGAATADVLAAVQRDIVAAGYAGARGAR